MKTRNTLIGLLLCLNLQAQTPVVTESKPDFPDNKQNMLAMVSREDEQEAPTSALRNVWETATTNTNSNEFAQSTAQASPESLYGAFVQAGLFATTDGTVPFWMRSRRFGSVPADGISASLLVGAQKEYNTRSNQLVDWGAGVEARFNGASNSELILIQAYAKARLGIFQLKAGRFCETVGLVDSTLSTGAYAVSGNALGIPQIQIGIPDYWEVPLTNKVFSVKGTISHGWAGSFNLNKNEDNNILNYSVDSYLHELTFYGRLGKPDWKIKLYGGLNHQVIWGHEKQIYSSWGLSNAETFKYVILGKPYGTHDIPSSKVGNHLGSIDQLMEWDMNSVLFTGYHQFFYEVGGLIKLANVKDGLWGLSLQNKQSGTTGWQWQKFLFEFLYSKSQGGEMDSKPRASGSEDYYNNFLYYDGWSYQGEAIGNPLFTTTTYAREGLPSNENQYFINNRLMAFHGGADFSINDWQCRTLLTYSVNWGTYLTSPGTRLIGDVVVTFDPPYFPQVNQFSALFETHKPLRNGFELGLQLAFDQGDLLYNSVGGGITLTKRW